MKVLVTDNLTGETKEVEILETLIPQPAETPPEPSLEEKVATLESNDDQLFTILAHILEVTP